MSATRLDAEASSGDVWHVDAAVIVALIALVGTVANVALTYGLNAHSERRREQQRSDAQWARYKKSLAVAAYELGTRLYNVLERDLLRRHEGGEFETEIIDSTLFRFAQYFGWSEVVRRYARDPDPRHVEEVAGIGQFHQEVLVAFSTDEFPAGAFMILPEAQRAIGELMVTQDGGVVDVIGVAGFFSERSRLRRWMGRTDDTIRGRPVSEWAPDDLDRLRAIQAALIRLGDEWLPPR